MGEARPEHPAYPPVRLATAPEELVRAQRTRPIASMDEFVADTFANDDELDEFLTFP
jgi:hypothetical protein